MSPMLKSRLILLAILLVWAGLLLLNWRGWWQIFVTLLSYAIKDDILALYCYGLWIAQDQDVNSMFFGNPDVTVSSKVGTLKLLGSKTALYTANVIDKMFYIATGQVNHCVASIEHDEKHYTFKQRFRSMNA